MADSPAEIAGRRPKLVGATVACGAPVRPWRLMALAPLTLRKSSAGAHRGEIRSPHGPIPSSRGRDLRRLTRRSYRDRRPRFFARAPAGIMFIGSGIALGVAAFEANTPRWSSPDQVLAYAKERPGEIHEIRISEHFLARGHRVRPAVVNELVGGDPNACRTVRSVFCVPRQRRQEAAAAVRFGCRLG